MPHVDLLVLGAGAAGAAAAIAGAQRGLKVALFERAARVGRRPGETLHPGAFPILEQLGVAEEVAAASSIRPSGITLTWAQPECFRAYGYDRGGPWRGYQIQRETLETILRNRCLELGVSIIGGTQATLLPGSTGAVISGETILARHLVDACGGRHLLARKLGIPIVRASQPLLVRYGYAEVTAGRSSRSFDNPVLAACADGWIWRARISSSTLAWARLFVGHASSLHAIPAEVAPYRPVGSVGGADVSWRIVSRPAGKGYFIAGDAAAVLDPLSSHGVLRALMSGMLVSHLASLVRDGTCDENDAASEYCRTLDRWTQSDISQLREAYREVGILIEA